MAEGLAVSDKGWVQFLLVAVPVLSLVGSWLALRAIGGRQDRRRGKRPRADEGRKGAAGDEVSKG
ncbi:hypothetical protein [Thauera sinica]|uniref:Uncharacterized protein n=1 Tax=Thauera sinica TaxID=2665146 RepID=A0ABW1AL38_9RHOO|nr:hypothetical protein [Thauera sp. K11]ATE59128.1 hypothetical protein CCZ27_03390 [Thauera sp. K11]